MTTIQNYFQPIGLATGCVIQGTATIRQLNEATIKALRGVSSNEADEDEDD